MSTSNDIAELLRKGIEAAREGNKRQARELFEQVVELDEKNEKGWFWLASVVDTDDERRICLSNVLHINPNNERAKRALDALQAKAKEQKAPSREEEVVAGVTRRQMTLIRRLRARGRDHDPDHRAGGDHRQQQPPEAPSARRLRRSRRWRPTTSQTLTAAAEQATGDFGCRDWPLSRRWSRQ